MSVDRPASLLERRADRLGPWVAGALVGHVLAGAALVALQALDGDTERGPLVDPAQVIEVELLAIAPKGDLARASRAPAPPPSDAAATDAPPPVRASDLTVPSDVPDPSAGPTDADRRRLDQLQRELEMERLLGELDAPTGTVDRDAASPDGVEGATASLRGGATGDPEFAKYIATLSQLFLAEFRPLPVLVGKGYRTRVLVQVDGSGAVTGVSIAQSSGNPSWDGFAERAALAVPKVPLPPERFRDRMAQGYAIIFEDP